MDEMNSVYRRALEDHVVSTLGSFTRTRPNHAVCWPRPLTAGRIEPGSGIVVVGQALGGGARIPSDGAAPIQPLSVTSSRTDVGVHIREQADHRPAWMSPEWDGPGARRGLLRFGRALAQFAAGQDSGPQTPERLADAYRYLAWTNLYRLAPATGTRTNPTRTEQRAQETAVPASRALLDMELATWSPRCVVFATETWGRTGRWAERVVPELADAELPAGVPCDYVRGAAELELPRGPARALVVSHPAFRVSPGRQMLEVEAVMKALNW